MSQIELNNLKHLTAAELTARGFILVFCNFVRNMPPAFQMKMTICAVHENQIFRGWMTIS